ncbi:cytochrome b [Aliiglaciecola sp. M165]|uniref:cytochrome b n=1 Tax=Aliiglaciecola sp. M165 TaxID=2593649 RepID=UPI00117BDF93|nr:cytochrome b [Aliiglaciecola sp. M165]TRY33970.1 cytochrome b [Aliiglaciecola sp. M165]
MKTVQKYHGASIVLHWLMFLLLIAVYGCIELRELFPKGSEPRELLKTWHFMLGLSVFSLVWLRLLFRFITTQPKIEPPQPVWQARLATAMHAALYLMMVGMPLAGWIILSAEGKSIPFFGLELPALVAANEELAGTVEDIHETIGTAGYYLIGLHTIAALFHHYIQRDNAFLRMLPGGKRII